MATVATPSVEASAMSANASSQPPAAATAACSAALDYEGTEDQKLAVQLVTAVCAVLTFVAYAGSAVFIARRGGHWTKRGDSLMTLSVYPVLSLVSMLAVLLPASAVICDAIIIAYLCVVLWNFKQSVMKSFGGKRKMMKELASHEVSMTTLPFTCCCLCLQPRPISTKLFTWIRVAIVQFFVVRPTLGALSSILYADNLYDTGTVSVAGSFIYINVVGIASTLTAMFGFGLLRNAASEHLSLTLAAFKFRLLQAVLVLTNIQSIIFTALAALGVIGGSPCLPAKARANELYHVTLSCELFVLAVAAAVIYIKACVNERELRREDERSDERELQYSYDGPASLGRSAAGAVRDVPPPLQTPPANSNSKSQLSPSR